MMMSRPKESEKVAPAEEEKLQQPKTTHEAVEDLERRLAMLGSATAPEQKQETKQEDDPPPSFAVAATEPPATAAKGGKNALLARIMAAQEKAKEASKKAEPAPPIDLLDDQQPEAPPPAFDETLLPPPQEQEPPPPFEVVEQQQQVNEPPPAFETIEQPPAPMAPAYEDLLDNTQPLEDIQPMQAPSSVEDEILGMEGLSEEERQALIEEQRQIMAQIEQEKSANAAAIAAAAADAFDQRSAPAVAQAASDGPPRVADMHADSATRTVNLGGGQEVALHGQERTRAAIADGTAILVQCVHCQNWMQVTETATLMFCPVCSVVSPVERQSAVLTREEAMQLTADRKMAEQLQQEEYADQEEEEEETWWDAATSLFGMKKSAAPPQPQPQQVAPTQRGELGVSRPPGGGGLVAAQTGSADVETIEFSNSYEEREGLLLENSSGGMQKARVAERQPLFSCISDSVTTAASSLGSALTATTLHEDSEGNVHGVDASSLLAVTRASRGSSEQDYRALPTDD